MPLLDASPRELFTLTKVAPPRLVNVALRSEDFQQLRELRLSPPRSRRAWASQWLASRNAVKSLASLRGPYLSGLTLRAPDPQFLPCSRNIADPSAYRRAQPSVLKSLPDDQRRCLYTITAHLTLNHNERAADASRLLQFIEAVARLETIPTPARYATLVAGSMSRPTPTPRRSPPPAAATPTPTPTRSASPAPTRAEDLRKLAGYLRSRWEQRNAAIEAARSAFEAARRAALEVPRLPAQKPSPRATPAAARRLAEARLKAYRTAIGDRRESVASAAAAYTSMLAAPTVPPPGGRPAGVRPTAGTRVIPTKNFDDLDAGRIIDTYNIPKDLLCRAYQNTVEQIDLEDPPAPADPDPSAFLNRPRVLIEDGIERLGKAELIRVTERLVRYTVGEISFVEAIMPGEVRRREVKTSRAFEQTDESVREETVETTAEADAKTSQTLHSEVQNELTSRFASDLSASGAVSGKGTFGVVAAEGSGAVEAGLHAGVDASFSSENSSDLTQEIVKKSLERVKSATQTRRLTKASSVFETATAHEINNAGGDAKNAIYAFLDKHIRISEEAKGIRTFLIANLLMPGRSLTGAADARRQLDLADLPPKPVFDVTPDAISPTNYLRLAARFGAADIDPPPEAVMNVARTYKTDTTNATLERQEFKLSRVTQMLVPFFERYKRHLITDSLPVPEGYELQDVFVTVNHGANGISLPAQLPLSLAGATFLLPYAALGSICSGFLYLPYYAWLLSTVCSPLLHFNADSSNVTACIGNQSIDSPYYFFPPDVLIAQIRHLLSGLAGLGPSILSQVSLLAGQLVGALNTNLAGLPGATAQAISTTVKAVLDRIKDAFTALQGFVTALFSGSLGTAGTDFAHALDLMVKSVTVDTAALGKLVTDFFKPVQTFTDRVIGMIGGAFASALDDLIALLQSASFSSDVLVFGKSRGLTKEVPVSFNIIAVNPGITINLNACLVRTDRAMDRWRLQVFARLYQAYQQRLAEYENERFSDRPAATGIRPSAVLRAEENTAIKDRVLHCLNNARIPYGSDYTQERITLFESALDWENISVKLYNYGPTLDDITSERLGAFRTADQRRRAFLTAAWAQVLVPLQPIPALEDTLGAYLDTGVAQPLPADAIGDYTSVIRDLIMERQLAAPAPSSTTGTPASPPTPPRSWVEIVPTELVVVLTDDLESLLPAPGV